MARADERDARRAIPNKEHPAEDEGPHHDFGNVRLGRQQASERYAGQSHHTCITTGLVADERLTPVEEIRLARKLPGAMCRDDVVLAVGSLLGGLNLAIEDEEEVGSTITAPIQEGAGRDRLLLALGSNAPHHLV